MMQLSEVLHESIGQSVYGIYLMIRYLEIENRQDSLKERLVHLSEAAAETLELLKRTTQVIRSRSMSESSIQAGLQALSDAYGKAHGVAVELYTADLLPDGTPEEDVALFHIVNEILDAFTRSGASFIRLKLLHAGGSVVCIVKTQWREDVQGEGLEERLDAVRSVCEVIELLGGVCKISHVGKPDHVVHWQLPRRGFDSG